MTDAQKFGKFVCSQDEAGFLALLEKFESHKFILPKNAQEVPGLSVFDIPYHA